LVISAADKKGREAMAVRARVWLGRA